MLEAGCFTRTNLQERLVAGATVELHAGRTAGCASGGEQHGRRSDRRAHGSVEEDAKLMREALISNSSFERGSQPRTVPEDPGR
jgi:hypothetical protein